MEPKKDEGVYLLITVLVVFAAYYFVGKMK